MNKMSTIVTMTLLSLAMAGCGESQDAARASKAAEAFAGKAERQIEKAGVVIDDAAVTAKVKTALVVARDLKGFAIDVDTVDNVVTLSGTVASEGLRQQAETVAKGVDGVKNVKNGLMVKQPL